MFQRQKAVVMPLFTIMGFMEEKLSPLYFTKAREPLENESGVGNVCIRKEPFQSKQLSDTNNQNHPTRF
jgi:hypothetical protein